MTTRAVARWLERQTDRHTHTQHTRTRSKCFPLHALAHSSCTTHACVVHFCCARLGLKHEITDRDCARDERSCISFSDLRSDAYLVCIDDLCSCYCRMCLQLCLQLREVVRCACTDTGGNMSTSACLDCYVPCLAAAHFLSWFQAKLVCSCSYCNGCERRCRECLGHGT